MIKILFVCHGNICRSPMAEFISKKIVADLGLSNDYLISSAATSMEEHGSPMYPPAARELYRRGVPQERREATLITSSDYDKYDVIALMDERNLRNIKRYIPSDPQGKIAKLLSFAGVSRDVSDPWYSGDFSGAFDDILRGCAALLCKLDPRITDGRIRALSFPDLNL